MRRTSILFCLCCLLAFGLTGQDKHFTQFYAAPLTLNPALTGAFNGSYRVSGSYRDQWRGALESPYVTFAGAVDVRWKVELDKRYDDAFAVGLLFFNDKVGGIDFTTNQMALSAAFHKGLDYDKKQVLSAGFQAGLANRNINYEDLTFDDQFNDIDRYEFATGENLPENNFSFSDFSVGLNYTFSPQRDMNFFAGFALHHVLEPEVSFYPIEDSPSSKLFRKFSGQLSALIPLSEELSLIPRALFAKQGPHMEINTGSNLRIKLNDYNSNALQIGSWVRPVSNEQDELALDALILLVGIELGAVSMGVSYDINLDALSNSPRSQNAIEFSVTYLGSYDDESILCPKF